MPALETLEELFDKMDAENEQDAIQALLAAPAWRIKFTDFANSIEASPLLIRKAICNSIRQMDDANASEERINGFLAVRKLLAASQLDWTTIHRALQNYTDLTDKLDRLEASIDDDSTYYRVSEISQKLDERSRDISNLEDTTRKLEQNLGSLQSEHDGLEHDVRVISRNLPAPPKRQRPYRIILILVFFAVVAILAICAKK
jgi:hypothetical protein